jgi:hypothetical protein
LRVLLTGQQQHGHVLSAPADLAQQFQTVHVRHLEVDHRDGDIMLLEHCQPRAPRAVQTSKPLF